MPNSGLIVYAAERLENCNFNLHFRCSRYQRASQPLGSRGRRPEELSTRAQQIASSNVTNRLRGSNVSPVPPLAMPQGVGCAAAEKNYRFEVAGLRTYLCIMQ